MKSSCNNGILFQAIIPWLRNKIEEMIIALFHKSHYSLPWMITYPQISIIALGLRPRAIINILG